MQAISQRMRELAVQSANGTYTDEDKKLINQEFGQLKKEIDRIASDTEFNGSKVLNGDKSGKVMEFGNGSNLINNQPDIDQAKLTKLLAGTKPEDLEKLGEGNFKLKFTRDNADNLTIELIDKSHFIW